MANHPQGWDAKPWVPPHPTLFPEGERGDRQVAERIVHPGIYRAPRLRLRLGSQSPSSFAAKWFRFQLVLLSGLHERMFVMLSNLKRKVVNFLKREDGPTA